MTVTFPDYSEYQNVVDPIGQEVVIERAHNGNRADHDWGANRAAAHAAPVAALGIYQYLVQSRDAATQANELCDLIGHLEPTEWLVCDLEEGEGNQQARWQAWRSVVMARYGRPPWLYSGLAFSEAHNLQPEWVADYTTHEPSTPWTHRLWQAADNYPFPWGRDDESVFDGTLPEFLAAVGITGAPTAATPTSILDLLEVLTMATTDPGATMRLLYRILLHREIDQSAYNSGVAALNAGKSVGDLIGEIQDSPEGKTVIAAERRVLGLAG